MINSSKPQKNTKVINIRLDRKMIKEIEEISKWEQTDRSTVIRKLLHNAIRQEKLEQALKLYQDGKVSIGRAAELAGVDLWTFHDELFARGITHPSDLSELEIDLATLEKKYQTKDPSK